MLNLEKWFPFYDTKRKLREITAGVFEFKTAIRPPRDFSGRNECGSHLLKQVLVILKYFSVNPEVTVLK